MSANNTQKIFFPVYHRIESEVIELASAIHFDDNQLDVYSLQIADLIIRCSTELESIAKEIYRIEQKKEPSKSGDCLTWMNTNWNISAKQISIISAYFHFSESFMPNFCPFDYEKNSPDNYYNSYNSIKHDRAKNLKKATVNTLIRVLGSLYILNLYYNNQRFPLDNDSFGEKLDKTGGSKIFSFFVKPCPDTILLYSQKNIIPDTCIYKITKVITYAISISYINTNSEQKSVSLVKNDASFQNFVKSKLGEYLDQDDFFRDVGRIINLNKEQFILQQQIKSILSIKATELSTHFFAELNKS